MSEKKLPITSYTLVKELSQYIAFRQKSPDISQWSSAHSEPDTELIGTQFPTAAAAEAAGAAHKFGGAHLGTSSQDSVQLLEIFLDISNGAMFSKDLNTFLKNSQYTLAPIIRMYFEDLRDETLIQWGTQAYTQPTLSQYAAASVPPDFEDKMGNLLAASRAQIGVPSINDDGMSQFHLSGKSPHTLRGSISRALGNAEDDGDFPISIRDMIQADEYMTWPVFDNSWWPTRLLDVIEDIQNQTGTVNVLDKQNGELEMTFQNPVGGGDDFKLKLGERDINPVLNPAVTVASIIENLDNQLGDSYTDFSDWLLEPTNRDECIRNFLITLTFVIANNFEYNPNTTPIPSGMYRDNFKVNGRPDDPSRLLYPSLAVFVISNRHFNPASRHVSQAALFSAGVPTTEMSLCSPFLRVNFIINRPTMERSGTGTGIVTRSNMISFLTDGSVLPWTSDFSLANAIEPGSSVFETSPFGILQRDLTGLMASVSNMDVATKTRTGMELFTSPQTLVNMDINQERSVKVLDPAQPLMTLNSVSIKEYQSGFGLIGFKRATVNITLHDRTRLGEIAYFISPASFGQVESLIEYGWSHPNSDLLTGSPWGSFLNSLRCVGKYRLIRGNYNMDQTGQIKITLEMGSMGGEESKVTHVCTGDHVHISLLNSLIRDVNATLLRLETLGGNITEEIRNIQTVSVSDAGNQQMIPRKTYDDLRHLSEKLDTETATEDIIRRAMREILDALHATAPEYLGVDGNASTVQSILGNIMGNLNPTTTATDDPFLTNVIPFADQKDMSFLRFADITYGMWGQSRGADHDLSSAAMSDALLGTLIDTSRRDDEEEEEEEEEESPAPPIEPDGLGNGDWVSLGKLVTVMVGHPLAATGRFDEVQVLFYTFNECSGAMQSRPVSDFPIRFSAFFQRIVDAVDSNSNLTTSRIETILARFVNNGAAQAYGFKDIYSEQREDQERLDAEREAVREARVAAREEHEEDEAALSAELTRLDTRLEDINKSAYDMRTFQAKRMHKLGMWRPRFKIPRLKFLYEAVPALVYSSAGGVPSVNRNKTILRIHVMDSNSSSHPGEQLVLDTITAGEAPAVFSMSTTGADNVGQGAEILRGVLDAELIEPRAPVQDDPAEASIQRMAAAVSREAIHDYLRKTVPTVQFGTAFSPFSSVSISGMSSGALFDALLSDTFRDDDDDPQEQGTNTSGIDEVTVVPVTAKASSLGNPMFHYGQQFYLDLKTGTTADNIFTVRDVTHNISPGTFTTDLSFYPAGQNATVDSIRANLASTLSLLDQTSATAGSGESRETINNLSSDASQDSTRVPRGVAADIEQSVDDSRGWASHWRSVPIEIAADAEREDRAALQVELKEIWADQNMTFDQKKASTDEILDSL